MQSRSKVSHTIELLTSELNLLDIIPDCRQWEFGAIYATAGVAVLGGDGTGGTIWAAQAVHTDDKETGDIKCPPISTQQWAPPVTYVGTASQSMADDHSIVSIWRQFALGCVGHGDVPQGYTGFQGEGGNNSDLLVWN